MNEKEKIDKQLYLAWEQKSCEHESDSDTNHNWSSWKSSQQPEKDT